jgi:membrane protease YdiL (CAAX protease family)
VALIWAGWHVPFALSGVQHIDGVSATSLALRMPLGIAASGLILGWLWLRTESVWMVALAHGTFNNWGQYAFKYIQDGPGVDWRTVLSAGGPALLVVGVLLLAFFTPEGQARHHAPQ